MTESLMDRLCSVVTAASNKDPICSASTVSRMFAIETPAPWGDDLYTADPEGTLQQRMRATQRVYFENLREHGDWEGRLRDGYPTMFGIQPDREWSQPDRRRVLLAVRPEGLFSDYDMSEYSFPVDAPEQAEFAETFFNAPEELQRFEAFRVEHAGYREFLVCTHGHVDICCAKFGIPLYQQARKAYPKVRAWRITHFGGHRYAPTAWEFPSGYKWAFLDEDATGRLIEQDADTARLAGNLRGWSGVPDKAQILDREGFKRYGWPWLDFKRHGEILEADAEARRWHVRLAYESPDGIAGSYEGTVFVARELAATGCGPDAGHGDFNIPEYALESLIER